MPTVRHIPGLYAKRLHPYYIVSPSYDRKSSGIRVMHQLCASLNKLGAEAYIRTPLRSHALHTPQLTPDIQNEHLEAGLNPIAIYPEIVGSNPLDCNVVVRYILNRPGLLGERPNYSPDDLYWLHNAEVAEAVPHHEGVLHMPAVDTSIFNNVDNPHDNNRQGACIYFGRYVEGAKAFPELTDRCTVITKDFPTSHEELAALFRRSTHVYCFENTSISMEARLCGCPVVQLPSPYADPDKPFADSLGLSDALVTSDDAETLAEARRLLPSLTQKYRRLEAAYWEELERLLDKTQAVAESRPKTHKSPTKDNTLQLHYSNWRARTAFAEIDAEILAERMMLKWTKRPGIHLLMTLHGGEEALLADTLDSLATQLYPDWLLTVVTDLPQPEGLDESANLQWLSLQDAVHINYVIDEVAAASPGSWLARIDPGLSLEPQALQVFADYINSRPMWHLIYCDEDTREADGSLSQPLFKPDFDLDLFRAQNYIGAFALINKEAFLVAGRYGEHRGAEIYDLSLRISDHVGPRAIGHISQMLVHLPRESTRAIAPEAEKAAVIDHLERQGVPAKVSDGIVYGTRRIDYLWPENPLVSIVIQTRDREEYLRPLLESMHELTQYTNYELVIVDNETSDPDALEWLKALPSDPRWHGRMTVIERKGKFNWSAGANIGAGAASGKYLLFLDNDIHVVQKEWLGRMLGIAQRPEVGVVGPRLAFAETAKIQDGGWILGLNGLAATPWNCEMELTEPGYMGRAVCDQHVGAVSGSALLVRASLFDDLCGFNETDFPQFNGALDLCLRVSERGLQIVWTPYSMLVHYGGVSTHERRKDIASALEDVIAGKVEREGILQRWLPVLASDPGYNKNLSLVETFKPDHIAPIVWDTNFHDRSRILGIPLSGGAGEYRLRAPLRIIARAGLAQTAICEPPAHLSVRVLSPIEIARTAPDSIIFHQPVDDHQTNTLQSLANLLPRVRRIITIDDLFTAVPRKNSFYEFQYKDARPRLRRTLGLADKLVVSTQPLADFCSSMIEDIRIMPNCLERAIWDGARPPALPRRKPRVGWAGAQQHLGDLEIIYPVVEALSEEVDWIFMGMCPDPLRPFVREFHDFVRDFEAYPAALAKLDLDLAIAPLELNAFNEAKSNLRLLEYGFMGWPVICTDIFPYQDAPVTRLPNEPQRWISAIREHLAEPEAMRAAGKALQEWVLANFILEDHATDWLEAYGP